MFFREWGWGFGGREGYGFGGCGFWIERFGLMGVIGSRIWGYCLGRDYRFKLGLGVGAGRVK